MGVGLSLATAVLIANRLGAGPATDAFFLIRRFVTGATEALRRVIFFVYVPPLVSAMRSKNGPATRRLLWKHLSRSLGVTLVVAVALVVFAPQVVAVFAPGFDAEQAGLATLVLYIMAFLIPAGLVLAAISSLLLASRIFGRPEFARNLPRLLMILLILAMVPPLGIIALSWTLLAGTIVAILLLIPVLIALLRDKEGKPGAAQRPEPAPASSDKVVGGEPMLDTEPELKIGGRILPVVLIQIFRQGGGWIDLAFASTLAAGSVSIMVYAQRIVNLGPAVLATSLFTVMYAELAHTAVDRGGASLQRDAISSLRAGMFILTPSIAFLWVTVDTLFDLLFVHGAFGIAEAESAVSIARVLLPVFITTFIVNNLIFSAYADSSIPHLKLAVSVTIVGLVVRFAALILLVGPFGIMAIPIASAIAAVVLFIPVHLILNRHWGRFWLRSDISAMLKTFLASGISLVAMREFLHLANSLLPPSTLAQIGSVLTTGIVGAVVYLGCAAAIRMKEFAILAAFLRGRGKKISP